MASEGETERRRLRRPLHEERKDGEADLDQNDDWDLDDRPGMSLSGASEAANKRGHTLRRTNVQVGLGCACHFIIMCCYMYIHVYHATVFERTKGKGYEGVNTYGGRWKYLTDINLVSHRKERVVF